MIYEQGNQDYQFTMFACDVDEKLFSHMRPKWLPQRGAETWLTHNRKRVYLRAYVFCDTVLERHNDGYMGFRDPVILWCNLEKQYFSVHPGQNRIILKYLLPDVRQVAWVIDNTQLGGSRKQYEKYFNNIKPIIRGPDDEKLIPMQMQHRTGFGGEDQYHLALSTDTYLGDKLYDTEERKAAWKEACKTKGFGCSVNGKFFYDIGRPVANYDFMNVAGIYQAFLHHFFDFPYSYWDKLYFKEIGSKKIHEHIIGQEK